MRLFVSVIVAATVFVAPVFGAEIDESGGCPQQLVAAASDIHADRLPRLWLPVPARG